MLIVIGEMVTLLLKGVDSEAEQATARKSMLTRFHCNFILFYAGYRNAGGDTDQGEVK